MTSKRGVKKLERDRAEFCKAQAKKKKKKK